MEKPSRPRIPHDYARPLLEAVLRRLDDPTPHLRHVERLVIFGSFAYGLATIDDVDVAIDYETKDAPDRAALEAAAGALDAALAALETHERQLEQDERTDARELASELRSLRDQLDEPCRRRPPTSAACATARCRRQAAAPCDNVLHRLADALQHAFDDWCTAIERCVPFPANTPSVAGAGLKQMLDDLTAGNERIYVYYHGIATLDDWEFEDVVLLWERGDALELALSRLAGIEVDPAAQKKERRPLHGGGA
jgi:predicted nucleotidyltransferase